MKAYATQSQRPTRERDRLIAAHIDVARRITLRLARRCPDWISRDDLIAAGMLGLTEAAERYDESRQEPFISFAEKRIRGAVLDELRRGDIMPRRVRQMARKIGGIIQSLERQTGTTPTDEQVAAALGVPVEDYRANLEQLVHVTVGAFEDHVLDSLASDDQSPAHHADHRGALARIRGALGALPQRDLLLLNLYYEEELTYAEIGEVLGVTTSRVCQLHGRAIARLRAELEVQPGTTAGKPGRPHAAAQERP